MVSEVSRKMVSRWRRGSERLCRKNDGPAGDVTPYTSCNIPCPLMVGLTGALGSTCHRLPLGVHRGKRQEAPGPSTTASPTTAPADAYRVARSCNWAVPWARLLSARPAGFIEDYVDLSPSRKEQIDAPTKRLKSNDLSGTIWATVASQATPSDWTRIDLAFQYNMI